MPNEYHFLHPSEIPRAAKKRVLEAEEEFKFNLDNQMVISEPATSAVTPGKRDRESATTEGPSKKKKTGDSGVVITQSGSDYKAKKAQGDRQQSGKAAPFAYVQFNPRMLSKKHK